MTDRSAQIHDQQSAWLRVLAYRSDDDEVAEWKSLNQLLLEFYRWRSEDPIEIDAASEIEMAVAILEDAHAKGLVDKYEDVSLRDTPLRISRLGERFLFDSDADESLSLAEKSDLGGEESVIDSSKWTGLPSNFELNEEKSAKLVLLLQDAERSLDAVGAGNHEKAMARAYIVAAKCLADAPDPPADLIWEILNRANNLAGVASLFVSIIALFTAVH